MIDPNEIVAARRALGQLLAGYRQAAGLNQRQLAPHTLYGRSTVANVETGRQNVPRSFWERADAALGVGGKLTAQYDKLEALVRRQRRELAEAEAAQRADTEEGPAPRPAEPGSKLPAPAGDLVGIAQIRERVQQITAAYDTVPSVLAAVTGAPRFPARTVGEPVVEHFQVLRAVLVNADNLLGPYYPLTIVREQIGVIDSLRRQARGVIATRLLAIEARWAEFAGWLCDDAGLRDEGGFWISRAAQMSAGAEDDAMVAYVLARRAQRAVLFGSDGDDPVELAEHARRQAAAAPYTRALATLVAASGHSVEGETDSARREIDAARDLVAWHSAAEPDGLGAFFAPAYVTVQEGECWLRLGVTERAVEVLENALQGWPLGFERDKGLALARLAAARLAVDDPDGAGHAALEAARVAERTGSARVFDDVGTVARELEPWRGRAPVDDLLQRVTAE